MGENLRIAVVDRHPLFRTGVRTALSVRPTWQLVGQGVDCTDAGDIISEHEPDILLLDQNAGGSVLDVVRDAAGQERLTRIIILAASMDEEHVSSALDYGARGYILKSEDPQSLIQAIICVARGESYVTPSLAASVFQYIKKKEKSRAIRPGLNDLTRRETEILYCVGLGLSNKNIAQKLRISEKTVKHYMSNILQKLRVENRVQAALIAQKSPPDRSIREFLS